MYISLSRAQLEVKTADPPPSPVFQCEVVPRYR